MAEMTKAGVQFYVPTDDEIAAWAEACGHQRPEWDSWKKDLAGSIETFDRLLEAANTPSAYYVHDGLAGDPIGASGRGAAEIGRGWGRGLGGRDVYYTAGDVTI